MLNLAAARIWLCVEPTDMRKSFDTLAARVREHLRADPLCGAWFVFRGMRGDRLKILYWDGDGFALWQKRLAKGAFEFCFALLGEVFVASPIIFGGIGTLLVWWFAKSVILWLLWHWLVWFVAIPSALVFGVCDAIAEHRVLRLRQALLGAATDTLAAAA